MSVNSTPAAMAECAKHSSLMQVCDKWGRFSSDPNVRPRRRPAAARRRPASPSTPSAASARVPLSSSGRVLRSATRARANANADDGAHAATIGDVLEVAANVDDGAHAADDGAHVPENEVNISSTLAQLRILIRLIHHVEL